MPNFRTIHYIIDFDSLPDNVEKAQSKGRKLEKVLADKRYRDKALRAMERVGYSAVGE